MKLKKIEIWLIAITLAFLVLALGFHLGSRQEAAVTVSTRQDQMVAVSAAEGTGTTALVNINTAGVEELSTLDGIGEVIAGRIVAYREEHGPFQAVEDLDKVDGIGPGILAGLGDYVTVGPAE